MQRLFMALCGRGRSSNPQRTKPFYSSTRNDAARCGKLSATSGLLLRLFAPATLIPVARDKCYLVNSESAR